MTGFLRDLRHAVRILRRSPLLTTVAVLSLAIGIGVNTLVFSIAHALLLRPFPVEQPKRLVAVYSFRANLHETRSSYPNFIDVRQNARVFSDVYARSIWPVSVRTNDKPQILLGALVSTNYFEVLGIRPFAGATLASAGAGQSRERDLFAVVSHRLWKAHLGADTHTLGSKLLINNQPFTVVGIAPEGFQGVMAGFACDVWLPIALRSEITGISTDINERRGGWLDMVARLEDGVTAEQAQAGLESLARELSEKYPAANENLRFRVVSGAASRFPVLEL